MKRHYIASIIFCLGILSCNVQAQVNIFACEPEWAALAEEIGGKHVKVFAATHAKQDPHHIRARPSFIAKIRRADLVICSGAGLEAGWLPVLMQKASAKVQPGTDGYLMASDLVTVLEKPTYVDRSMGDVHPEGNPHVHLDPHNISIVSQELLQRLSRIDSANSEYYDKRFQKFNARWEKAIVQWEKDAAPLDQKTIIVHHKNFIYLITWLNLRQVGSLEPRPGIPPTTGHLEDLLIKIKEGDPVDLIFRASYESADASEWLSKQTGIPAIMMPYTVGGDSESKDLFSLFDRSISLLIQASSGND